MTEKLLDCLRKTLEEFIADFQDSVLGGYDEISDIEILKISLKKANMKLVSEKIIRSVLPLKKNIKESIQKRDPLIFKKILTSLNSVIPEDKIEYYCKLLKNKDRVTEEDITTIFSYIDVIVETVEEIKKNP